MQAVFDKAEQVNYIVMNDVLGDYLKPNSAQQLETLIHEPCNRNIVNIASNACFL